MEPRVCWWTVDWLIDWWISRLIDELVRGIPNSSRALDSRLLLMSRSNTVNEGECSTNDTRRIWSSRRWRDFHIKNNAGRLSSRSRLLLCGKDKIYVSRWMDDDRTDSDWRNSKDPAWSIPWGGKPWSGMASGFEALCRCALLQRTKNSLTLNTSVLVFRPLTAVAIKPWGIQLHGAGIHSPVYYSI